jgi:hypothetical protein
MPRTIKNDVNKGLYDLSVGSLNPEMQAGSFKSFFRKLGKTAKSVASDVGKTALNTAVDVAKQGVSTAIQHPELVAEALSGTGLHDRMFEKELDKELNKHTKSGGSMVDGGSLKSIARQAFQKSKKLASKQLDKTITDIKNKVQPDIDNIKASVSKKATDFADDKYNQLKGKIQKTLGTTDTPSQSDEQTASGLSGGKRKISAKMQKRNLLVKKIMKEKGMKMVEASKYIKAHNLL